MVKIVAISGSIRNGSYNTALLRAAQTVVPADCQIELASITEIPFYNEDDEKTHGVPAVVTALKEKIIAADALLISTPEYNHGIPGVIKNAIDWCTRPPKDIPKVFHQRKVGLIGASPSKFGTAFSQTVWLPMLTYLNVHLYSGIQLFVGSAHTVFNEKGELSDKDTAKFLQDYMQGFVEFIRKS
jgi:chromate reductase